MQRTLIAMLVSAIVGVSAHAQPACTARIESLQQFDDHIEVMGSATMSGCSEYVDPHQAILIQFLSDVGGRTCGFNNDYGTVCETLTPTRFETECLAEGTYTVFASAACSNGNAAPCYPPSTGDHHDFTITRIVDLTDASATPNQSNPAYWDIQAGYDIPNTYEIDRSVTVYDAATNERLGGCGVLVTPSGTCTATAIDPGCGREVRVEATACATTKKGEQYRRLPPGQTTVCPLRSPVSCPDCEKNRQIAAGNGGSIGGPINVGGGDVSLTIPLFSIAEPNGALSFALYYESQRPMYASISGEMGYGWSHSFAQSLTKIDTQGAYLYFVNPQGMEQLFQGGPSVWVAMRPTYSRDIVTIVGTEYHITTYDGNVTAFDIASGHWNSTTDRWGDTTTATYDAGGNLTGVTDPLGRTITIVASGTNLQQVTLPGGATWTFTYTNNNLTSINDPLHTTSPWRTLEYTYSRVGEPRLLTAMKDDAGVALETHTYDTADRAITSGSANGRDQVTVDYTASRPVTHQIDGSTTQTSNFTVAVADSQWVATTMTGGCASCSSAPGDVRQYDNNGRISQLTNAAGVITTYNYDGHNNLLSKTEAYTTPLARTSSFEYLDSTWPSLRTKDNVTGVYGNRITTRTWNPAALTLTETETANLSAAGPSASYTTTTTFDTRHRALSIDGPRTDLTDVTTRTYYPDNDPDLNRRGRLHTTTNAAGLTTTYDNYDIYGTPRLITDPNGVQTTVETDDRGRTTAITSQPVSGDANESTAYRQTTAYDSRDRVTQSTTAAGNVTGYSYEDGTNRLTDTIRYDANGNQVERLHLTLNLLGWKTAEEAQACASPAPTCAAWVTDRSESYTYTDQGQLKDVVHTDNTKRSSAYDALLRLVSVQDENHTTPNTTYTYDVLNRLHAVTQTLGTAIGGTITTTYTYNILDQLATVTDPNANVTTYTYDDFGRLTAQASPVTGTTTYAYDAAGNLITTTDANGATTVRSYDAANRITSAVSTRAGAASENIAWTYDATAGYGKGRLTSTSDPTGTSSYAYDRRGLLRTETKTLGGDAYVTAYSYDPDGNRSGITSPSGRTVTYTFDFAGRPASATTAGIALASSATYLPFGPLGGFTYGNGTTLRRTYDDRYRILTNRLAQGPTTIAEYDYGYDTAGNITSINDMTDATYNRAFAYDDINRLVSANSGNSLWGSGAYSYDSMGNLQSLQNGSRNASFSYTGTTPKLTTVSDAGTATSVAYDAAGNETSNGGATYTYTSRNSLATNAGFTYSYDARGVRTIATTTGTGVSVASLSFTPTTVAGGDAVAGTVTLSGPAPTGGATVALTTDDQRIIQVPPNVFVAGGTNSATFTAGTLRPLANSVTGTVRAFHQGSTTTASITVTRVPRVSTVTLNPPSVTGGNTTSATVSIDIATTADTVVTLASSNAAVAALPASVTIAAGSTSAAVNVTTTSVVDDTTITVTATYRGTATGVLAVTAIPVTVSALNVNPTNVAGGRVNATGTVTLNRVAGANGAVVSVTTSNTGLATVPGTATVPSGATTATFPITTSTASAATPVTITATYGTTQSATLTVASCNDWTAGAATLGSETVWFDDAVPAGARRVTGTWTWDTAKEASGTQSHVTLTTGTDSHSFDNYPNFFHFTIGDQLVQYVLVDPCNPPAEIMLEFGMCCDGWMHRAFWGQDLLNNSNYGLLGKDRVYMGPIPTGGQWTRLTAPTSQLSMSGSGRGDVYGVQFDVAGGGHVWFDRTGEQSCTVPGNIAPPPSFPSTDVVWFDDTPPTGASLGGWTWDTSQKASGTKSHNDPSNLDFHNHYFQGATQTITPQTGDSLFTYVLLDPCDPPNEVMVYWYDGNIWNHIAYWGPNAWGCGNEGPGCHNAGPLPSAGGWVRLSVPASAVGLEGHTLSGMAFAAWNGHAWFDRAGIQPAGSGALRRPAAMPTVLASHEPQRGFLQRLFARWRREPAALGFGASAKFTATPNMAGPTRQYSFYTPELHLLAETALTDASAPPIQNDYMWFGGEPLAQISSSTGDVAYYFNDHLGAPLLQLDTSGSIVWRAERDPYGNRYAVRAGGDRHQPLGLPGQELSEYVPDVQYNIFRWYRSGWGRYTQVDPVDSFGEDPLYQYARDNPLTTTDPSGLKAEICCRKVELPFRLTFASPFRHCFLWNDGFVYELLRVNGLGQTSKRPGIPRGKCEACSPKKQCDNTGKCLDDALSSYPQGVPYDVSIFSLTGGPNSNTFAKELSNKCCAGGFPRDMSSWWNWTPGVGSPPPVPDWQDRILAGGNR